MNLDDVNHLPIELRREIYIMLPKRHCLMCGRKLITFCHVNEYSICSLRCCINFNKSVLKDIIMSKAYILSYNWLLMCNYILFKLAVFTCYGTGSFVYLLVAMAIVKNILYLCGCILYYVFTFM